MKPLTHLLTTLAIAAIFFAGFCDRAVAGSYFVATNGNDTNPGSISQPWRTIQKAANTLQAGDSVFIRAGVYEERVTMAVSGSETGGWIVFTSYQDESVAVDGSSFTVPASDNGMILIDGQHHLIIQGLELRNYRTAVRYRTPSGIFITGTSHHIRLLNNHIHHIETNYTGVNGGDAHGIAVYGRSATASIHELLIEGNRLNDLKLGSSEALAINGNVEHFRVASNLIHDCNNIAFVFIGYEETCPDPALDRARNGVVCDNTAYNISSYGNPAYGNEYAAGGIYVDGGRDILIERNTVYQADIGIEIASEHTGRMTSSITVRNNFLYRNNIAGIAMGGYDVDRGGTENCVVVHNTLFENDVQHTWSGELMLQNDIRSTIIKNNIIVANSQSVLMTNYFTANSDNTVDYNIYFAPAGVNNSEWQWKKVDYAGFTAYLSGTGNDAHSYFANPQFVSTATPDLHIQSGSPARNAAQNLGEAVAGILDIDREMRQQGPGPEIGADEYAENVKTVQIRLFLQGACAASSSEMTTALNDKRYLPLTAPYSEDAVTVSYMPATIVDWVLVEIRTEAGAVLESISAFLRKDGYVCDIDGQNGIHTHQEEGYYRLAVRHRNHLAARSATAIAISPGSTALYDFTAGVAAYAAPASASQMPSGLWAVRCGDINRDGQVTTRDYCRWYNRFRLSAAGYEDSDLDLDGTIRITDYALWLQNALLGSTSEP